MNQQDEDVGMLRGPRSQDHRISFWTIFLLADQNKRTSDFLKSMYWLMRMVLAHHSIPFWQMPFAVRSWRANKRKPLVPCQHKASVSMERSIRVKWDASINAGVICILLNFAVFFSRCWRAKRSHSRVSNMRKASLRATRSSPFSSTRLLTTSRARHLCSARRLPEILIREISPQAYWYSGMRGTTHTGYWSELEHWIFYILSPYGSPHRRDIRHAGYYSHTSSYVGVCFGTQCKRPIIPERTHQPLSPYKSAEDDTESFSQGNLGSGLWLLFPSLSKRKNKRSNPSSVSVYQKIIHTLDVCICTWTSPRDGEWLCTKTSSLGHVSPL